MKMMITKRVSSTLIKGNSARPLTVKDELDFEALPEDTKDLCKRMFDFYARSEKAVFSEGFNEGIETVAEEKEDYYKRGYEDAKYEYETIIENMKKS